MLLLLMVKLKACFFVFCFIRRLDPSSQCLFLWPCRGCQVVITTWSGPKFKRQLELHSSSWGCSKGKGGCLCWWVKLTWHYCAFQKHANSKVQKLPSQLRFSLPSIIITITSNEPWNTETHKTDRNPPITNHKPWPFEPVKVKFCFLRGPLRWLTAAQNAILSWLSNFSIRMFVKSAVRRFLCSGRKKNIFFTDPKIAILNIIYYPEKKDVTIIIRPGKEENFVGAENQHLSFKYWNLQKRAAIFCNWCCSFSY